MSDTEESVEVYTGNLDALDSNGGTCSDDSDHESDSNDCSSSESSQEASGIIVSENDNFEKTPDETSERASDETSEEPFDEVSKETSGEASDTVLGEVSEDALAKASEEVSGEASGEASGTVLVEVSENASGEASGEASEEASGEASGEVSEKAEVEKVSEITEEEEDEDACDSNSGDELHQMKKQMEMMNQNFIMMRSLIAKGMENIKLEVQNIQDELIDLKQQVDLTIPKGVKDSSMVEVKKNDIDIPRDVMMKYIHRQPLTADKQLFKYYYLNNKIPPIKKLSPSIYEYWSDGQWNLDRARGRIVIDIICHNLRKSWLRLRPSEDVKRDVFLNIQTHIDKLSQTAYQNQLLRSITEDLDIPP